MNTDFCLPVSNHHGAGTPMIADGFDRTIGPVSIRPNDVGSN